MLDIRRYMKALNDMGISQESLGFCFGVASGTISNWITGKKESRASEKKLFDGAEECRNYLAPNYDKDRFIIDLIEKLDISQHEKEFLYATHDKDGYEGALRYIVHLAKANVEFVPTVYEYDPRSILRPVIGVGQDHVLGVLHNGRVRGAGSNEDQQCHTYAWRDIVSVCGCWKGSVGLRSDGKCVAVGKNVIENGDLFRWENISSLACGTFHVLGLKANGTVLSFGRNPAGQCNVSGWKDVKGIAAGANHSVGLLSDGTVVAVGKNNYGQCDVQAWSHVIQIAASGDHTLGLTEQGSVLATGDVNPFKFENWSDIVEISTGTYHAVGLKQDGTVVNTGYETAGLREVERWHDMIAIAAGYAMTAGVRADGRVFITHDTHRSDYIDTSGWRLFEGTANADSLSKFNLTLEQFQDQLRKIRDTALNLAPFINQFHDHFHDDIASLDNSIFKENYQFLFFLSKDIWGMHDECRVLPTIEELITRYSCAFVDFNNTLNGDEKDNRLTKETFEAYQLLLMTINQLERDAREIANDK